MVIASEQGGLAIRADLAGAIERSRKRLMRPGTWWDGPTRSAMVAEARNAHHCALCRERKDALSPYAVTGDHDSLGELPDNVVEVIHRVATDCGRLTETWYQDMLATGLSETEYVEIIGVVSTISALDTFSRAIGEPMPPLPAPEPGEPTRHRPVGAKVQDSWVPTLEMDDIRPEDPNPYPHGGSANIHKAMSCVPEETAGFFDLVEAMYMAGKVMRDFGTEHRAVSHAQCELMAARLSVIHQCIF